tara:strand:- start:2005 stop:2835 length:831 start_codon:yes stop_codon:yes gene_type:complete
MITLIIGNGESRSWFKPWISSLITKDIVTWGCNAIYRDGIVDNLVSIDYPMQQEIYNSGYARKHPCWFNNWDIVPDDVAEVFLQTSNMPKELIFINEKGSRTDCVIQGKYFNSKEMRTEELLKKYPHLDKDDLDIKLKKDVGLWITYVDKDDKIKTITWSKDISSLYVGGTFNWSAGNTAIYLACQEGAKDVYLLGFDFSSYEEKINNIYKNTKNYLPAFSRGFNSINWLIQLNVIFKKFKGVNFYWIDCLVKDQFTTFTNIKYLTKEEFRDILGL